MRNRVEQIVKKLALTKTNKDLFNPYNQIDKECDINTAPGLRQSNLRMYLRAYQNNNVKEIWVAGFLDSSTTKLSGIPLISPRDLPILQNILGIDGLLENPNKNRKIVPNKLTNTVWNEIKEYNKKPLVWCIIPFYIHPTSRRNFNIIEYEKNITKYVEFLHLIIDTYKPCTLCALNTQVQEYLSFLNVPSTLRANTD